MVSSTNSRNGLSLKSAFNCSTFMGASSFAFDGCDLFWLQNVEPAACVKDRDAYRRCSPINQDVFLAVDLYPGVVGRLKGKGAKRFLAYALDDALSGHFQKWFTNTAMIRRP